MFKTLHPEGWKPARGYANGVLADGTVFVGGQVGWNADLKFETDDFVGQCAQALHNVVDVLAVAGAQPGHIVRMTWYVTDKREYLNRQTELGSVYRHIMGKHFPAMTMVQVTALIEDRAKVEIEATAVLPRS